MLWNCGIRHIEIYENNVEELMEVRAAWPPACLLVDPRKWIGPCHPISALRPYGAEYP